MQLSCSGGVVGRVGGPIRHNIRKVRDTQMDLGTGFSTIGQVSESYGAPKTRGKNAPNRPENLSVNLI